MGGCTEETVLIEANIPASRGAVILTDCNAIVVPQGLSATEREEAVLAAEAAWRRGFLRAVG